MNKNIIIGYSELKISLPLFVAQEEGLFLKHKLDNIELRPYPTAQLLINDLASHIIHLGGYTALPIAFSVMNQTELLFIGGIHESDEYPISFLLIQKGATEILSIKDLEGKRIGILPTKAYRIWIETILEKEDVNLSAVEIIDVDIKNHERYLKNNRIDALFTNDPMASYIISKEIGVRLSEEALVPKATGIKPFYFGSFNITTQFAKAYPNTVQKITKALDEAILLIGKNPYIVEKSLKKYLPHTTKELIGIFPKTNFKTSKNITNYDLKIMQLYYYQQNLYKESINIENLQYEHTHIWYRITNYLEKKAIPKVRDYQILISFIIGVLTLSGILYKFQSDADNKKVKYFEEQKKLVELRKSQQAQFRLEYNKNDTYTEPIKLVNIGRSALKNVRVQMEIYFISNTYEPYAASNLKSIVSIDNNLLKKFQNKNIINTPNEFTGWFDTERVYTLFLLEGNIFDNKSDTNKMDLDFGSFSLRNAVTINKILKMQIVMRLKIKYNEEMSGKLRITNKYIWFDQNKNHQIIRRDLENVYGGRKIIKSIRDYEDNTKDIIFNHVES